MGNYCSYCERTGDLHVEHVVLKSKSPKLEEIWDNFMLGCGNCNSRKSDMNSSRKGYMWPDRDDTHRAFEYRSGGRIAVNPDLPAKDMKRAEALFDLTGLDASGSATDPRRSVRRRTWELAEEIKEDVKDETTQNLAVKLAVATGNWSIWMTVFEEEPDMKLRLIESFPGTRMAR